jgi:hypothetical protein
MATPARFEPLQRASRSGRLAALLAGPVLWLVGIVLVGIVVNRRDSVGYAVTATLIAFVVSLPICWFSRVRRVREERRAGH